MRHLAFKAYLALETEDQKTDKLLIPVLIPYEQNDHYNKWDQGRIQDF